MNFGDCYNCYEGLHGKQLDDKVTFALSLHIMLAHHGDPVSVPHAGHHHGDLRPSYRIVSYRIEKKP